MSAGNRLGLAGALALCAALLLGACTSTPEEPEPSRAVHAAVTGLPAADVDELQLPYAFQDLPTYALPYDDRPLALDGVLLGLRETGGVLEFTAVTTDGRQLWSTQRPASCSGFTLTRAGEEPLAILTDVRSAPEALAQVTASAYHLRTGELVWGPTPVAGPWHGPGAVFAEAAPPSAMGEVGERQALDARTGEEVDVDGEVLGEFDGTVIYRTGDDLRAAGASEWRVPLADVFPDDASAPERIAALPGADAPAGYALLAPAGAEEAAVVRVADGHVVATGATSAAWDPAAQILVVTGENSLAGYSPGGAAWSRSLPGEMRISASGGVLTYLRSADAVQVVNALTGEDAVGYDPEATGYAVPALITEDGGGVFALQELTLVGTHGHP